MSYTVEPVTDVDKCRVICTNCGKGMLLPCWMAFDHKCINGERVKYRPDGFEINDYNRRIAEYHAEIQASIAAKREVAEPSLLQKTKNFAKAATHHVKTGSRKVDDETVADRFAVCQTNGCGLYKSLGDGKGVCMHKTCGCNLRAVGSESMLTPNKLRWADTACPIGLWGAAPAPEQKTAEYTNPDP
jgi:hypothetical protein